jgi:ketopantoate reductase
MCPACIVSTAALFAGAGSMGGILAACLGTFRKFFSASVLILFHNTKEK